MVSIKTITFTYYQSISYAPGQRQEGCPEADLHYCCPVFQVFRPGHAEGGVSEFAGNPAWDEEIPK
jgi:hypothetical protein